MVKIITDRDGEVEELTGDFAVGAVMSASEDSFKNSIYLIGDAKPVVVIKVLTDLTSEIIEKVSELTGCSQAGLACAVNTKVLRYMVEKNGREGGETDENLKNHNG